jgi:predicted TIM-barrel fold metal-dependent hydrolase
MDQNMTMPNQPLEAAPETALDPTLLICDPHHHLWDRPNHRYFLKDFLADTGSGHDIVATVAVECRAMYRQEGPVPMRPVGETEFLENIAASVLSNREITTRVAAGIVGHVDLTLGDAVAPVLEGHMSAGGGRFRGIRHSTTWDASEKIRSDAPPGLLADRAFRKGIACLGRYGLSFDAWLYHPQLAELVDLARAFPQVTIILDHIGGPLGIGPYAAKRNEVFEIWRRGIADLAACPNVTVKLGGLSSERSGFDWHQRAVRPSSSELVAVMAPYFEWCIEKLGVARCMFESNFPVEKRANSYVVVWNTFKRITQSYSASERKSLFHDTAARVYRIDLNR